MTPQEEEIFLAMKILISEQSRLNDKLAADLREAKMMGIAMTRTLIDAGKVMKPLDFMVKRFQYIASDPIGSYKFIMQEDKAYGTI